MPAAAQLQMAELLLCAGARGPILSRALQQAWDNQFLQMANLLAAHGASMGSDDASVLKDAIRKEEHAFVESLLGGSSIDPALASECVTYIPKQISPAMRSSMLKMLLRSGASGDPLHEMLIDAAEAGDLNCVRLLLKPYIRDRNSASAGTPGLGEMTQEPSFFRHAVASPDYKSGKALQTAILRGDQQLVTALLEGRPSHDTLAKVFPFTSRLDSQERHKIVKLFLQGTLTGPSLHSALQTALSEERTSRDGALIQLLLEHNADINYMQGAGLRTIIADMDIQLLAVLVQKASPQTVAARIADAMAIPDHRTRHDMVVLLLRAGAAIGASEVASALLKALEESPVDMSLLRLLLQSGSADVNAFDGSAIQRAIHNPDPKVLELVLTLGKPLPESISRALTELGPLPSTEGKTWKLKIILSKSSKQEDLGGMLVNEVQSLVQNRKRSPSFSTLEHLLESGADTNAYGGAALHHAVRSSDAQIMDVLFKSESKPTPSSLGSALPHALRISDPMDRLTFTKRLVDSGAEPLELNRALIHAINAYKEDLALIKILAEAADTADGEALNLAVTKEATDIVDILLARTSHTEEIRDATLQKALAISDREKRREICGIILKSGTSVTNTSAALLIAARDGDLPLGDILIAHGATISPKSPSPIIEACRHGSTSVLGVLLKASPATDVATLKRGFQAATEVGDLNKRAIIFEMLLERGVKGEIVDMQLGSAARYGDDGSEILRVLLAAGADPDYNRGDAVVAATKSAFLRNLELLLGLWDEKKQQKRPSHPTLVQAMKAAWKLNPDTRFQVLENLFKAGLLAGEDLHIALCDAINEDEPEEKLVKLLLEHGASPTANECKALIDATNKDAKDILKLLLGQNVSTEHLGQVFASTFTEEKSTAWYNEHGLVTARSYVDKGVKGAGVSAPLVIVMRQYCEDKSELAESFIDLLLTANPDPNYNHGEPLRIAASQANVPWTSALMECRPNVQTLSFAFQHIFDTALPEDGALALFRLFSEYRDGETRIDVTLQQRNVDPILVRAMSQYPRKATILETLLDAGLYYDQMTTYTIHEDIEEPEEMTLLIWALAQPQKPISPALIEVLLERGANVNARTNLSRTSPLMVAIQTLQPDVVRMLLLAGAEVDVADYRDRTPLSMATAIGGDIGTRMMGSLLAAEPSLDDGSLHNAARALNLPAVKVLVQAGHDPDFPSASHGGRSALGEVCLRAGEGEEMTLEKETALQKIMSFLVGARTDLEIKSQGKSLLYLCFESPHPLVATRILLKVAMWKHINKSFNNYTDGSFTFSPTMYLAKLLPPSEINSQLLALLRANRAQDIYYANSGPQPDDAVGLPEDMEVSERARRARLSRLAEESEDFALTLARRRELANIEKQIQAEKAEMEDARRRRLHSEDLSALRSRASLTNSLEETAFQRRLSEQHRLADQATQHARTAATQRLEADDARQRKALEWEGKLNTERVDNARALSQLRIGEREEVERIEKAAEGRMQKRLEAQRKVVESQEKLARRLAQGPQLPVDQRRQIGYVSEELN